MWVVRAGGGGI